MPELVVHRQAEKLSIVGDWPEELSLALSFLHHLSRDYVRSDRDQVTFTLTNGVADYRVRSWDPHNQLLLDLVSGSVTPQEVTE